MLTGGVADDLVIHVRNIHHVVELEAALAQKAAQDVHGDKGAEVADVAVVIHCRPARVHADGVVHSGSKLLHPARKRVVKLKGQTQILGCAECFEQDGFWLLALALSLWSLARLCSMKLNQ